MKFSKLDLLTLLISLFIFASCEKTSTIGLEVDPANAVQGILVDTVSVSSRTVRDVDAPTYGTGSAMTRYPMGYLNDPLFGTTESNVSVGVGLPSDAYSFGDNAVLDSAVLVLNFGGEFYGDSTANYSIDVNQLTNNLAKESSYLSAKTYPYQATVIGSYTGKIFPNSPFKVLNVVTGAADTLATVKPQIRIKLSNSFITSSIINSSSSNLKTSTVFQEAFKGLHIQIKPTTQAAMGNGGMAFFNLATTSTSGVMLYYKKQNATTTTLRDTVAVNFPLAATAASVKRTYTTAVQTQLDNPNTQYATTFLQPLGGLRNKVSFPYLKKLKESTGNITINKAELVVDLSANTYNAPFKAAPRLALYRYDIAGQRKNVPDNDAGNGYNVAGDPRATTSFGGYFDSVNKRYVFVVTAYLQDLLDGKTEDYGTFLAVTPSAAFEITPSFNVAARAVVGSFKKNPTATDNTMKLNVYYTKIN